MDRPVPLKDPNSTASKASGFINQTSHHRSVCTKKILNRKRIKARIQLISLYGIFNFLNLS